MSTPTALPSSVRSAAMRVNALVARHGHDPAEPRVVMARQEHAELAITAEIRRRLDGLPPLSAAARARLAEALEAR